MKQKPGWATYSEWTRSYKEAKELHSDSLPTAGSIVSNMKRTATTIGNQVAQFERLSNSPKEQLKGFSKNKLKEMYLISKEQYDNAKEALAKLSILEHYLFDDEEDGKKAA